MAEFVSLVVQVCVCVCVVREESAVKTSPALKVIICDKLTMHVLI